MKTKIFEQGGGARWKIKHLLFFVKQNFDRRRLDSNQKKNFGAEHQKLNWGLI